MDAKQSELERTQLERTSSEQIRNDIRGTRREMDETLEELGDRLHPRHLLDDLIDIFRSESVTGSESRQKMVSSTKRLGRGLAHQIREHPVPALLAGIAIARWIYEATEDKETSYQTTGVAYSGTYPGEWPSDWTPEEEKSGPGWRQRAGETVSGVAGRAGEAASRMGESVSGAASTLGGKVSGAASSVGGKVSGAASSVGGKVSEAASVVGEKVAGAASVAGHKVSDAAGASWERIREGGRLVGRYSAEGGRSLGRQAGVARDRFNELSDEFPLPVGGVFLAAGILAGLLLPRTQREDEWMGETSDQLKDETKAKGEELLEMGKDVASRTAASALHEAESRGLTPSTLVEKAGQVAAEALKAGKEAAQHQGMAPSTLKDDASAVVKTAVETAKQEGKKQAEQAKPKAG